MKKALVGFVALLALALPAAAQQPNIIIIMADDQSESLPIEAMPNVKNLIIDQGVRFTNSFADFSLCCPNRAAFLTGIGTHNHGIKTNDEGAGGGWDSYKPFEANSLPVWLQAAGYRTALLGKYVNGYDGSVKPVGWNRWLSPLGYYGGLPNDDGTIIQLAPDVYGVDLIASEAVEFMQSSPQPYFMVLAVRPPHFGSGNMAEPAVRYANASCPAAPRPPSFNEANVSDKPSWVKNLSSLSSSKIAAINTRYCQAYRALLAVNDLVGVVVAAAGANDIICYVSDNGFFYGEHRIESGKVHAYEPSLRVPMACRGPGIPVGEARSQLVNTLDLTASIIDWADAIPGRPLDGASLLPILADNSALWRGVIFFNADKKGDDSKKKATGVRTLTRKYVKYSDGFEELYDLALDPDELVNVKGNSAYSCDLTQLRALRNSMVTCSGAACFVPAPPPCP